MADDKEFDQRLARFRKLPVLARMVVARPRTFVGLAVAIAVVLLLPESRRLVTRMLVGWDVFATIYLVLAYFMMFRCDHGHIHASSLIEDDGRPLILMLPQ